MALTNMVALGRTDLSGTVNTARAVVNRVVEAPSSVGRRLMAKVTGVASEPGAARVRPPAVLDVVAKAARQS